MKKWTKAEREEAARKTKAWHARRKRDVRTTDAALSFPVANMGTPYTTAALAKQELAIDVVKLIAHDVPADVIVKVVERILRP